MRLNGYLLKSTVTAALGGLLFGFDTAVISGTTSALTLTYDLSPGLLGFTVSVALWGTVIGSLLAGIPENYIELKEPDQSAAPACGCNLRNVHRPEHR